MAQVSPEGLRARVAWLLVFPSVDFRRGIRSFTQVSLELLGLKIFWIFFTSSVVFGDFS